VSEGAGTLPEPRLVLAAGADLGEGPLWDDSLERLLFVDISAGLVHSWEPDSGREETIALGSTVGCVVLDDEGALVAAAGTQIVRIGEDGERTVLAATGGRQDVRFNDGACDPQGRFWAGTMALDERPGCGTLYRLDERGLQEMINPVSISNGIDWSLDGRKMYYVDSTEHSVCELEFDPPTGELGTQRTLIEVGEGGVVPDGLVVDAEGCIWLAVWDGWCVRRYADDGRLLAELPLPVARPTSCAFGGEGLGELFVTSARTGLSSGKLAGQPGAGGVFATRPGVAGRPANRFRYHG
jgi:sugar lactone lactonase YvrE